MNLVITDCFQRRLQDVDGFLQHNFGFMHVVALHEVHAELEQYRHFIGVLNAFGNGLDLALLRRCRHLADAFL